jgi:hypothetical protein
MIKMYIKVKWHLSFISLLIILMSVILLSSLTNVSAGDTDATFDSITPTASPPVQGIGGEVRIEVSAKFYGGCCYHLFAYDVKPELITPNKVQIIGSSPKKVDSLDAVPGGKSSDVNFKWTVIGLEAGTYDLKVKVNTSNCGSKESVVKITIIEGASVSNPSIFPSQPSVGEPITISVDVSSGSKFVDVDKSIIYFWGSPEDYSGDELIADGNKLYLITENIDQNDTLINIENISKRLLGHGKSYQMNNVDLSDTWRLRFDGFEKEENTYYWVYVETSNGKNITSYVYKETIEDLEKKYQMLDYTIYTTLIVLIIGTILILGISWSYFNRPAENVDEKGIFILGGSFLSRLMEGKRSNVSTLSIERYRNMLIWLIIILTIVTIVISIYLGLFQSLVAETGG